MILSANAVIPIDMRQSKIQNVMMMMNKHDTSEISNHINHDNATVHPWYDGRLVYDDDDDDDDDDGWP